MTVSELWFMLQRVGVCVTCRRGFGLMARFIAHLYILLLHSTNRYMAQYVFSSLSFSVAVSLQSRAETNCSLGTQNHTQNYFRTNGLQTITLPLRQALWDSRLVIYFFNWTLGGHNPYVTLSPTRGRVCSRKLMLAFASAVILRSESHGTHDRILLSQIRDSPNLKGHVPVFISLRNRVAQLYPQARGSLFFATYDSHGYGGGIGPLLHPANSSHLISCL
jgi:hypothetical protein